MKPRVIAVTFVLLAAGVAIGVDANEGNYPIVLIPGWHGNGDGFREMIPKLEQQGFTVLDFDQATPGTQALSYAPTGAGQHIPYVAGKIVEEAIQDALAANGYAATQKIDIVAHSMGGLVSRFLIEQPGADVDYFGGSGWYGDGTPDVRTDWASRVDDLIMLGTPNHGTWEAWVPTTIGGFGNWNPTGGDMAPGSTFLDAMGYAEPAGEQYHAIGGDPAYLAWLSYDYDGDGVSHGFDGVVPAESPYVTGATMDFVNGHHGELLTDDDALDLIITFLGMTSTVDGVGAANLAGDAVVRLEYFYVNNDHDSGTSDEYVMDVYVDPDGSLGNAGYTYVGSHSYSANGPSTQNWGDTGPTMAAIQLPGTSPVVDVKVVVKEDDTSWGGGWEQVSTHYITDLLLSEDIDGMDYYEDDAADSEGGTNTIRVSLNGVTSNVADTRQVRFGFDKAYIQKDHDWGNGEVTFYLNAGRLGFESSYNRGEIGGTHYSREDPAWVNIGTHAKNNGQVESEIIWQGRMLEDADLRFDITYWEDDGGWSGADGGNMYYLQDNLASIGDGRTNYQGTAHNDFDAYIFLEKEAPDEPATPGFGARTLHAVANPLADIPNGPDDPPGIDDLELLE